MENFQRHLNLKIMEQPISLLPSQSKVHLLLLINPSDKIFNFLAIDIRNFPGNNIVPIYINIAISCLCHNELHEQLMQQFHHQQQYVWIFCTLFFILREKIKNLFRFVHMVLRSNKFESYRDIMTVSISVVVQRKVA